MLAGASRATSPLTLVTASMIVLPNAVCMTAASNTITAVLLPCGAQALFSNSKALGGYMGDTEHRATAAITLAVLGFGLTDVSLNVLQVCVRALVIWG